MPLSAAVRKIRSNRSTQNKTLVAAHAPLFCACCCCCTRAVDEMGVRIDELENSIGELMSQAGIEEEAAAEGAAPASAEVAAS